MIMSITLIRVICCFYSDGQVLNSLIFDILIKAFNGLNNPESVSIFKLAIYKP